MDPTRFNEQDGKVTMEPIYDVHWERAGTLEAPKNVQPRHVLYRLCGHHPVYGANVLLYVGKMVQQAPGVRLAQHRKEWGYLEPDAVAVRVASVRSFHDWNARGEGSDSEPTTDPAVISDIERLLIYAHQPAYNSQNLQARSAIPSRCTHLRVFNTGQAAPLLLEVSTRRYLDIESAG